MTFNLRAIAKMSGLSSDGELQSKHCLMRMTLSFGSPVRKIASRTSENLEKAGHKRALRGEGRMQR